MDAAPLSREEIDIADEAAALCLQAFVGADAASRAIEARDRAVNLCQSAAEVLRTNGGDAGGAHRRVGDG